MTTTAQRRPPVKMLRSQPARSHGSARPNVAGGVLSALWLVIVAVPLYWIVITSVRTQQGFFGDNPLAPPASPTLDNFRLVLANDFGRYLLNSTVVTVSAVVLIVVVGYLCAYAIVRAPGRRTRQVFNLLLLGLAIPLQATIIPIYLMIVKAGLYDNLLAIILPSVAFALPITVLILVNFLRDIPGPLFEAMRIDGASDWQTMLRLAVPLSEPAIVTVAIYDGLNVWNGFLFPLILTQSPEHPGAAARADLVPGDVHDQRPGGHRCRRPLDPADPRPLRLRTAPAPRGHDGGVRQVSVQDDSCLPVDHGHLEPEGHSDARTRLTSRSRPCAPAQDESHVVSALLARLTTEERLGLLDGDGEFWRGMLAFYVVGYNTEPLVAGQVDRLGIPGIRFADGPRGCVLGSSTSFPVSMARGATWDVELEREIGRAIGAEIRAQGGNYFGGVCINLLRHPAWGRAQETYGEDPVLLGAMGEALLRGAQEHVMGCVKHFALNSMENARFTVDVSVADDVLREVYLPHFRQVVDAGAASVMASYNSVNGQWAGQSTRAADLRAP